MTNDERILELKQQIEARLKKAKDAPEPKPITNRYLTMGSGERLDLNTVPKDIAISVLVDLNCRRLSADDLGIPYSLAGHPVETWIADLQARLSHIDAKREQRHLDDLKRQLERLLSKEKKTELAVDAIADELRNDNH